MVRIGRECVSHKLEYKKKTGRIRPEMNQRCRKVSSAYVVQYDLKCLYDPLQVFQCVRIIRVQFNQDGA